MKDSELKNKGKERKSNDETIKKVKTLLKYRNARDFPFVASVTNTALQFRSRKLPEAVTILLPPSSMQAEPD